MHSKVQYILAAVQWAGLGLANLTFLGGKAPGTTALVLVVLALLAMAVRLALPRLARSHSPA